MKTWMTTVLPYTLPLRSNAVRKKTSRHPQKVVQFLQVLPVALEIDAQHDWDTEDELVDMRDGMKAVCIKAKIAQLDQHLLVSRVPTV